MNYLYGIGCGNSRLGVLKVRVVDGSRYRGWVIIRYFFCGKIDRIFYLSEYI